MSARELISGHLDLWTGAVTKKSSSGRGSNGKVVLTGVKKLRELILELALRGLLTDQLSTDESADNLLEIIIPEVKQLIKEGRFKVPKETKSNSGVGAPFKIPHTWTWCSLHQIAGIARGGSPRPINSFITTDPNGLNWIKIGDATKGSRLITKATEKIAPEGLHKTRMVYPGDLILSNSMSFGQPYILDIEGCIHDGWLLLRTPEGLVDKVFLYYLLLSPYAMNAFRDSAAGAVVQNLNADKVRLLQVPLPPLEEQHRIVQKVDELMALCDRLEQQTSDQLDAHETLVDTLLGTLTQSENATELADNWARLAAHFNTLFTTEKSIDKLKQTILQLAVMGRLVEQDAGDEPFSYVLKKIRSEETRAIENGTLKKRKKYPELSAEDKRFQLPAGWNWAKFDDIASPEANALKAGPFGSALKKSMYVDSGYKIYGQEQVIADDENVGDYFIPEDKYKSLESCRIRPGDILISLVGTIGKVLILSEDCQPGIINPRLVKLSLYEAINREYISLVLSSPLIQAELADKSHGGTMNILNLSLIKDLSMPIPPVEEQHRIVQKVDDLMALCDQLKERLNQASETRCQLAEAVVKQATTTEVSHA